MLSVRTSQFKLDYEGMYSPHENYSIQNTEIIVMWYDTW